MMIYKTLKTACFTFLVGAILGLTISTSAAGDGPTGPNWKASVFGVTAPDPDNPGFDCDIFGGTSSHLGAFTAEGCHMLFEDFTFAGYATYTASNGDSLDITYAGHIIGFDPDSPFPIRFITTIEVVGGTDRLENAQGNGLMEGGFTGVPGEFSFDINGTLHPQGK